MPARALVVLISIAVVLACDDASVTDAQVDQHCIMSACGDAGCPPNDSRPLSVRARSSCAPGDAAAGDSSSALPQTNVIVPPCAVCARAEVCCKAQGLTNCSYTVACTSAPTAGQAEFYVSLCRAVLEAARAGPKTLPDVCGF